MYKVTFTDGTEFDGGEPEQSMWDCLPSKPIKSVVYWLKDSPKYSFSDFEEYNHCVERVRGVNTGTDFISLVIIMGRIKNRVYQMIFDLKTGEIKQDVPKYGEEYKGRPLTGWKFGILYEEENYPGPKLKKLE